MNILTYFHYKTSHSMIFAGVASFERHPTSPKPSYKTRMFLSSTEKGGVLKSFKGVDTKSQKHTHITHTLVSFYGGWNELSYMNLEHDISFLNGVWYCGIWWCLLALSSRASEMLSTRRSGSKCRTLGLHRFGDATVEQTAYFDSDSLCVFDNPAGNFCLQFANAISDRSAAPHNNRITVFLMESMRRKCTWSHVGMGFD